MLNTSKRSLVPLVCQAASVAMTSRCDQSTCYTIVCTTNRPNNHDAKAAYELRSHKCRQCLAEGRGQWEWKDRVDQNAAQSLPLHLVDIDVI